MNLPSDGNSWLLLDPNSSDFQIVCGKHVFQGDQSILCSQSSVFAELRADTSQDASKEVIKKIEFDAHTVERMLQFLYTGDYATTEDALHAETPVQTSKIVRMSGASTRVLLSPLRKISPSVKPGVLQAEVEPTLAREPMAVHAYVHGIAKLYDIPNLQSLSLQRFQETMVSMTPDNVMPVAKAVYACTEDMNDGLRQKFLEVFLEDPADWMENETFIRIVAENADLHLLSVDLMRVIAQYSPEPTTNQKKENEAQAAANHFILTDLGKVTTALQATSDRAKELEIRLKTHESDTRDCKVQMAAMEAKLRMAEKRLEKSSSSALNELRIFQFGQEEAVSAISKLEGELKTINKRLLKMTAEKEASENTLKETEAELQKEASRAKSYKDLWKQQQGAPQQIQTTVTKKQHELLKTEKDNAIKEERGRADRYKTRCRELVNLISDYKKCRRCGVSFNVHLVQGGNSGSYLLCCTECGRRHE